MRKYSVLFSVSGRGQFPADMLRHDCCYPADTMSASGIVARDMDKIREIHLRTTVDADTVEGARMRSVTPGRWSSFGWVVAPSVRIERLS